MNKRLVVVVETERLDSEGNKHPYSFTFPYGAPAQELFSALNDIGADLQAYVKDIIDQQEIAKAQAETAGPIEASAEDSVV